MTKPAAHQLIVPPTYMAEITGVKAIRVGVRKVWAILMSGEEVSVKLKDVTVPVDEGNFARLADEIMDISRRMAV